MWTQPVGEHWPARLAVWLLYRLTGPEQLARQLHRTELSMWLALAGIMVALALTWNLARTLRRQRLEQERLHDHLRRAEHLAGLGKLLAGVAHEVRNPLAAIRSTVQLWQRLPDTTRTPASLDAVIAAVDRMNALIGRLLYFARADNAQREPVDVNRMLTDTLELIRAQAGAQSVTLETDLAASLPAVPGSTAALQQVALNLLTNALQAMPSGGRLRCSTRAIQGGRALEMRIADTGPGIAPEARQHLFEPFYTTRPDGTGLGLALCREIVANHGGTIELLDEPGAVFRVVLPCA
jgi:two-component system sensor histidine kinase HydH